MMHYDPVQLFVLDVLIAFFWYEGDLDEQTHKKAYSCVLWANYH